ncbi:unnamed protein product [Ectocarpus sp. 12 AP-2014]
MTSSVLPAFPWSLSVESLGIRDGNGDAGPMGDYAAAEPVATSEHVQLLPPCTNGDARLQQVIYLIDVQSSTTSPATVHWAHRHRCFVCRGFIRTTPVTLSCRHVFHGTCLEDLMRNARFGAPGSITLRHVAAVTCPFCGEQCAIRDTAFFRVECWPLPGLASRPPAAVGNQVPDVEDLPHAVARLGPFEALEEFARRVANGGSAVLAALQADVDRIAFPPFAPGRRWATLVALYREHAVAFARARREAREQRRPAPRRSDSPLFARCGDPGTDLAEWATIVDTLPGSVPPPFPWGEPPREDVVSATPGATAP